jgi:hypothetical protein
MMEGINSLRRLAADQQELSIRNNQLAVEKNTNDYLDQVAKYTTAADISDPTVQQNLLELRQGYGQMIDRAATRDAIDTRQLQLQKLETASNAFSDQQLEREQRPLIEQITAAGRSGDKATVNRLLDENSFINEDQVAKSADQALDAVTNRGYAAEAQARAGRAEQRAVRGEARADAQFNLSQQIQRAGLEDRQEARQERRDGNLLKAADMELKSQEAFLRAKNPLANTSTDPIKDANDSVGKIADDIAPWLTSNAPARDKLTNSIAGLMSDGLDLGDDLGKVKIPKALVDQFLSQAKDKTYLTTAGFGSGENGGLLGDLKDWMRTYAVSNPGAFRQAAEVGEQIKALRQAQNEVNSGRIDMLRGKKLDSVGVSDMLESMRTGIPTNSRPVTGVQLLPGREEDTR